jgi:hypothetical protein
MTVTAVNRQTGALASIGAYQRQLINPPKGRSDNMSGICVPPETASLWPNKI